MSCAFCAYNRRLDRSRAQVDEATVRRFGKILAAYAAQAGGARVLVSWLGGEPLLWPPLEAASRALRGHGFGLSVTTNGLGLGQPRWRAWAFEALDELTVSLDGLASFHDAMRDQPGSHAIVIEALRALSARKRQEQRGPLLRVNTVLMRQNAADLEALCEELGAAGVDEVTFNQLGGNDRPEFYPEHRLLPEQVEALGEALPCLQARFAAVGLTIAAARATSSACAPPPAASPSRSTTAARARTFWFIDEAGLASPCSFTVKGYGVPIVALRTADNLEALPARWAEQRRKERLAPCRDCHSTQVFDKFQNEEANPASST